jgi:hypothetical protein
MVLFSSLKTHIHSYIAALMSYFSKDLLIILFYLYNKC